MHVTQLLLTTLATASATSALAYGPFSVPSNQQYGHETAMSYDHAAPSATSFEHAAPSATSFEHAAPSATSFQHAAPSAMSIHYSAPSSASVQHSAPSATLSQHIPASSAASSQASSTGRPNYVFPIPPSQHNISAPLSSSGNHTAPSHVNLTATHEEHAVFNYARRSVVAPKNPVFPVFPGMGSGMGPGPMHGGKPNVTHPSHGQHAKRDYAEGRHGGFAPKYNGTGAEMPKGKPTHAPKYNGVSVVWTA